MKTVVAEAISQPGWVSRSYKFIDKTGTTASQNFVDSCQNNVLQITVA